MKRIRILTIGVMLASMLFMSLSTPRALGSVNPGVLPPDASVQGMTLGQWNAEVFRATYAIPASQHPGLGYPWPNCYLERIGNVGIGVGYWNNGSHECEMPVGMMLYMTVIGAECSTIEPPPFYGGNEEELRACALTYSPRNLEASIDGIRVRNLEEYTALTPLYQIDLPEGNVLGVLPGTYDSIGYSTGFLLAPLSPGEHTIIISGELNDFGITLEYHITVTN